MKRSTPAFYLLSFLFLTLLIFIPKLGWSANIVWDGGAVADNNWSNPENWVGDVLPTSSDEVTFSGLSSNDSVNIDTNITVTGITINNSYSGTITQNSGSSITLNGSWVQDTGTFSGGDSDITITLNLNLSGGSFTATSTNLSLGGSLVYTAGTFSHNNGTVILTGNGCNMTLPDNSQSFYNLKINFASDGNNLYMYNASSVDITHLLTLTNGQLGSGTYKTPQFSHAATFDGGSATLTVNSGSETSTINSAGHMPKFILNSTTSTINISGSATVTFDGNVELTAGTFNWGTNNYSFSSNLSISGMTTTSGSGSISIANDFTISSGSFTSGSGAISTHTVLFSGGTANLSSASSFSITGSFNLSGATFTAPSTINLGGSWVFTAGTFSHNNGTVNLIGSACNMTLPDNSQSFYNLVVNFSGDSSNLYMYTASSVAITNLLTLSNGQIGSGTYNTPQFSHAATFDGGGGTVAVTSGSETSTINSSAHMPRFTLSSATSTINVSGSSTVTFDGNVELSAGTFNWGTNNYSFSSNLTLSGITTTSGSGNISITNDFTVSSGSFTTGSGSISANLMTLSGGTVNLGAASSTTVNHSFNLSGATFTASEGNTSVGSWVHTSGSYSHNNGTVIIATNGTTLTLPDANQLFYNLTLTNTHYLGNSLTVENNLILNHELYNNSITLKGNMTLASTVTGGTTAFNFTGNSDQTISLNTGGIWPSGAVSINKTSASNSVTISGGDWSLNSAGQDLNIAKGILNLAGNNLSVNDEFIIGRSGTLKLQGDETITGGPDRILGGGTVHYTGTASSYTVKNWNYSQLTINGASNSEFSLANNLSAGRISVVNGILNFNGYNVTTDSITNTATIKLKGSESISSFQKLLMHLDEESGTIQDSSGNGITGTEGGTLGFASSGKFGNSINFDGSSQITLSSVPHSGTGAFTYSAWIKTSSTGSRKQILSCGNVAANEGAWFFINSSNQVAFDLSGTAGTNSSATVTDNSWHHVAVVYDGSNAQIYVDGSSSGSLSATLSANIGTTDGCRIGNDIPTNMNNWYFNGSIDDVAIYNRALGEQEIVEIQSNLSALSPVVASAGNLTGTVEYTGDTGTNTYNSLALGNSYYNLTINGTSDTFQHTSPLTVNGNLTINSGTLNSGANDLTVAGDFSNSGTYNGSNTINFLSALAQNFTPGTGSYQDLYIAKPSSTVTLGGNLSLSGSIGINGGEFIQGSRSISTTSINHFSGTFTGGSADITLSGSFSQSGGAFTSTSSTLYVAYNFTRSGGTFTHNNGTVNLNGAGQTIDGSTTFYDLVKSVSSADTLTLTAATTQTISHSLNLSGASGQLLTLESSAEAFINPSAATVSYLSVSHNTNNNGGNIHCWTGCVDAGNNSHWSFATPSIAFTTSSSSGSEATTSVNFEITLSTASSGSTTVDYTVTPGTASGGGVDYTLASGTATITNGNTTTNISATINNDTLDENDETFVITLSNPTNDAILGTNTTHTYTILDNDAAPSLSINDVSNPESSNATFTVSLSAASAKTITVNYASSNVTASAGSDYTAVSSSLTFNPGETSKTIEVTVNDDTLDENDETFNMTLDTPSNASISDATGVATIVDNDAAPSLSINDVSNPESSNATFTVSLSAASAKTITVNYSSSDATATTGQNDYTEKSGTLTFNAGETSKTITVLVNDDSLDENDETFSMNLDTPTNASISDGTGIATIVDNDGTPSLSINDVSNPESSNATFTVSLSAASAKTITVNYSSSDATATTGQNDYTEKSGTLTFNAGETSKTITVLVNDDSLDENDETFSMNLDTPTNASISDGTGIATIVDNDGTPTLSVSDVSVSEAAGTATITVSMTHYSASTVSVAYETSNGSATAGTDYTASSGTLTWTSGQTGDKTFSVSINNDSIHESDETFNITLSSPSNASISDASAVITITDNDADSVTAHAGIDRTIRAGSSITLNGSNSTGSNLTYSWVISSGNGSLSSANTATPTFTVPAGTASGTTIVTLNLADDQNHTNSDALSIFIIGDSSQESLNQKLLGYVGSTSIIQGTTNSRDSLSIGDLTLLLPTTEATNYSYTSTQDGKVILGLYERNSGRGQVYITSQPVNQLSGTIDLEDTLTSQSPLLALSDGITADENLGKYLATGDINGDGHDEILIVSPNSNSGYGTLYIYDNSENLISTVLGSAAYPIRSIIVGDFINGTEKDILFGPNNLSINQNLSRQSNLNTQDMSDAIFVISGNESFASSINLGTTNPDFTIDAGANKFISMALGDLNGDGNNDLIVSANNQKIYIFPGKDSNRDIGLADAGVVITSTENPFGLSLQIAEVSGDSLNDLIIGNPSAGDNSQGSILVIFGMTQFPSSIDTSDYAGQIELTGGQEESIGSDLLISLVSGEDHARIYTIKNASSVIYFQLTAQSTPESTNPASGGGAKCSLSPQNKTLHADWMLFLLPILSFVTHRYRHRPEND